MTTERTSELVNEVQSGGYVTAEDIAPVKPVATALETLSDFKLKVHQAKMEGNDWVETSPEIIKYYNPKGMNGVKYFWFDGVKVCELGKSEEIEQEIATPLAERMHGKSEGVVVSG